MRECNGSEKSDGRIIGFAGGYPLIFIMLPFIDFYVDFFEMNELK